MEQFYDGDTVVVDVGILEELLFDFGVLFFRPDEL